MQKAFSQWSTNTESHHITGLETQRSCAAYWHKGKTHTHTIRWKRRNCVRFLSFAFLFFLHKLPRKITPHHRLSLSLKWQLCVGDFSVFFSPLPQSTSQLTNKRTPEAQSCTNRKKQKRKTDQKEKKKKTFWVLKIINSRQRKEREERNGPESGTGVFKDNFVKTQQAVFAHRCLNLHPFWIKNCIFFGRHCKPCKPLL